MRILQWRDGNIGTRVGVVVPASTLVQYTSAPKKLLSQRHGCSTLTKSTQIAFLRVSLQQMLVVMGKSVKKKKDGDEGEIVRGKYQGVYVEADMKDSERMGRSMGMECYCGQMEAGTRAVEGRYVTRRGEVFGHRRKYREQWKNDHRHDKGKQQWNDGSRYEGQWKDNKKHGYGSTGGRTEAGTKESLTVE